MHITVIDLPEKPISLTFPLKVMETQMLGFMVTGEVLGPEFLIHRMEWWWGIETFLKLRSCLN